MASRREPRLPTGNNALAEANIELDDRSLGAASDMELTSIFSSQSNDSAQGQASTLAARPARVLMETDYAPESCQASYETQVEVSRAAGTLTYTTLAKRRGFQKATKKNSSATNQGIRTAGLNFAQAYSLSPPDDALSTVAHKSRFPNEHELPIPDLAANLVNEPASRSPAFRSDSSPLLEDHLGTENYCPERLRSAAIRRPGRTTAVIDYAYEDLDIDEDDLVDPTLRDLNKNQPSVSASRLPLSESTETNHRSLFVAHRRRLDADRSASPSFVPSRRSAFEDHTRSERNLLRTINQAASSYDTRNDPARTSPRSRKSSNTPGRHTEAMDNSALRRSPLQCGDGLTEREFGLLGIEDRPLVPLQLDDQDASVRALAVSGNAEVFTDIPVAAATLVEELVRSNLPAKISTRNSRNAGGHRTYLQKHVDSGRLAGVDYSQLYPEELPPDYTNIRYIQSGEEKRRQQLQHLAHRISSITADGVKQLVRTGQLQSLLDLAKTAWPMFSRPFAPRQIHKSLDAPPTCRSRTDADAWPDDIPTDLLNYIATNFLSHRDVGNLRLVNKLMCADFSSIYFRSVVTQFGVGMFAPSQRFGDSVNKFGISFEIDLPSLYHAKRKVSHENQESWWGNYTWPKPTYQRFPELEALEEMVDDNKPLLKQTLQNLPNATELALSIDSGHGWLSGPDMSDMQVWDLRHAGTKVFGKTFRATDTWEEHLRNELFRCAQQNTINQSIKYLVERSTTESSGAFNRTRKKLGWLQSVRIRDNDTFKFESAQNDHNEHHHTGGPPRQGPNQNQAPANPVAHLGVAFATALANANAANAPQMLAQALLPQPPPPVVGAAGNGQAQVQLQPFQLDDQNNLQPGVGIPPQAQLGTWLPQPLPGAAAPQPTPTRMRRLRPEHQRARSPKRARGSHSPQWPLIYNGYNLAAEVGGQNSYVQDKLANPASTLLKPGQLSEAQAQWLMETFWAQRAFLSAYTTSVILNKANLKNVHALNIAKISSGLLPLIEQHEFWRALPGLTNLTIMVSPDWRQEHIPGDQSFQTNMLISPVGASAKLMNFLKRFICNLENLSKLTIGFIGGGEHATGMLARNQHVLPAPIIAQPRQWISDHHNKPHSETMISFNHIKKLKFENCWFSPCMLLAFMEKSRDTSLRHLTFESVSLTTSHAIGNNGITTPIEAQYGNDAWLNETLPNKGCWPAVLDAINPGRTFLEQKQALGFHLSEESELEIGEKSFRGNVNEITLNSCGYVSISGITLEQLNQAELLRAAPGALDEGLLARKQILQSGQSPSRSRHHRPGQAGNGNAFNAAILEARPSSPQDVPGKLMMSTNDVAGHEYLGLGTLTQAVHPIEKRVLEQAWGMKFGWGDDLKRWSAVDDGFYEGGTGRFSGRVLKDAED